MKPNPNPYQPFLLLPLTHTLFTPLTLPSHSFYSSYTSSTLSLSLSLLPSFLHFPFLTSFSTLYSPLSTLFSLHSLLSTLHSPLSTLFSLHSLLSSLSFL